MPTTFDSDDKLFIRERWNKPILKFLSKRINDKLVYLGLPSPSAEDIHNWIEYVKTVIAFQCRDYPNPSDESQGRADVEKLNEVLKQLERERKIDNYVVFDGYLEEVVLRGYDNSPTQIVFELSDFITLYNLDFCNQLTSPLEFIGKDGEPKKAYKFNAINKLLHIQQSLSAISKKFAFFLTVHCSYDGAELTHFVDNPPTELVRNSLKSYYTQNGEERNSRIVRLFFAYHIQQCFAHYSFTPKIMPVIHYNGLGGTPLLHFTVFGSHADNTAGSAQIIQPFEEVLNSSFIRIDNSTFINSPSKLQNEVDVDVDPVQFFSQSQTFQKSWNKKETV